jgi:hypothetical protein
MSQFDATSNTKMNLTRGHMRLTVLDDDPGRKINLGVERYAVFLDAIEVKHVFTADDEKGEVIAAVPDELGYMTTENGEVKRYTLYGSVRIEPCQR